MYTDMDDELAEIWTSGFAWGIAVTILIGSLCFFVISYVNS